MTTGQMEKGAELKAALEGCATLGASGPEIARLWLEIRDCVCTRGCVDVVPYGSARPVTVTDDYAGEELVAAMEWLIKNEDTARSLDPESLFAHISSASQAQREGVWPRRPERPTARHDRRPRRRTREVRRARRPEGRVMSVFGLDRWIAGELGLEVDDPRMTDVISPAIDILISRIEEARSRGADDPLVTITAKSAGGNSRECTKRMLSQLGLEPTSRRAVHRLLGGSPSGWSGLLRIFSEGRAPDRTRIRLRATSGPGDLAGTGRRRDEQRCVGPCPSAARRRLLRPEGFKARMPDQRLGPVDRVDTRNCDNRGGRPGNLSRPAIAVVEHDMPGLEVSVEAHDGPPPLRPQAAVGQTQEQPLRRHDPLAPVGLAPLPIHAPPGPAHRHAKNVLIRLRHDPQRQDVHALRLTHPCEFQSESARVLGRRRSDSGWVCRPLTRAHDLSSVWAHLC